MKKNETRIKKKAIFEDEYLLKCNNCSEIIEKLDKNYEIVEIQETSNVFYKLNKEKSAGFFISNYHQISPKKFDYGSVYYHLKCSCCNQIKGIYYVSTPVFLKELRKLFLIYYSSVTICQSPADSPDIADFLTKGSIFEKNINDLNDICKRIKEFEKRSYTLLAFAEKIDRMIIMAEELSEKIEPQIAFIQTNLLE